MEWYVLTFVLSVLFLLLYLRKRNGALQSYWIQKGIPQVLPNELTKTGYINKDYIELYQLLKIKSGTHGGIYENGQPVYVPLDPELIKNVLVKDFDFFRNRGLNDLDEKHDPLALHLFHLKDERWKTLRTKLTPTFTTGKMKMMFQQFLDCADNLTELLNKICKSNVKLDVKDISARFGTDVIASCAFGIKCNSLKNPEEEFRKHGKKLFNFSGFTGRLYLSLYIYLPVWLKNLLDIQFVRSELKDYFFKVVKEMVDYRENNNVYRPDFFHMLLQLKNRGKVVDDDQIFDTDGQNHQFLSVNEFTAQCFVFFGAGFETSSSVLMFALYELAKNQDCQAKLRQEVRAVLEKNQGHFSYESIAEMPYLEQVAKETLRLYPSLANLFRICTKNYVVPGTDVEIEKNTVVRIPISAIQRDPEYYPDPDRFDPDRFSKENEALRPKLTWLPFGEGPRHCIGLRFGLLQVKLVLAVVVKDFNVTLDKATPMNINLLDDILTNHPAEKIWLQITSAT